MRVIAGKARGRHLLSVPGETTRPITDRVREALFNIIGDDIQGATFLDLFAGTGSVGIEALSRGAGQVQFIDLNRAPVTTVRENLKITGLDAGAEVLKMDAFAYLELPVVRVYDYVYIAPPQYKDLWRKAVVSLDRHPEWISEDAWVIAQIYPKEYQSLNDEVPLMNLVEFDQRRYGSTLLVFYRRK